MENKMLIEATHPEETRVVVVRGNRIEEFDFEAENKKQLKGNIYLAKVTRVEPSLQAAFVDYGGNRHGFLAFSEIHPDYYQIPVADRQALLEEEAAAHKASDNEDDHPEPPKKRTRRRRPSTKAATAEDDAVVKSEIVETDNADSLDKENGDGDASVAAVSFDADEQVQALDDDAEDGANAEPATSEDGDAGPDIDAEATPDVDNDGNQASEDDVESVGSEDALEEVPERGPRQRAKHYKIQEVIKRRQIILVQVVKEERGNKGAALTTYLSLAGRYSVLMPNTDRGGGISRKITNQTDRKRLRTIASSLDVTEGMGVILRTAGASRTKTEIKRDFEYLMRLWENVRDLTLKSSAPALVYEEGSLLKRSIRDLYNKDIKQIVVAGDEGYREAKDFMRMLMPSHAKNVQPYKDPLPMFARYGVEAQLDAMFSPQVTLKSGGYIVINQTEALVSIDVNSGRSTRESSIEDTALSTNLETAEEVARQLRLRDLAGLIVIDFIDMEEKRNNRAVERRLKECLHNDRARIQVGRISHFGLLEMSRQRIRAGVLESTMEICPHCEGTGYIRSPASIALHVLRAIEEYLLKGSKYNITARTKTTVALYVLNFKRAHLMELECRFGLTITIEADESIAGSYCTISRGDKAEAPKTPLIVTPETVDIDAELARDAELDAVAESQEQELLASEEENEQPTRKRRRRRRSSQSETTGEETDTSSVEQEAADGDEEGGVKKKRRRRGRRGGRRERERNGEIAATNEDDASENEEDASKKAVTASTPDDVVAPPAETKIEVDTETNASVETSDGEETKPVRPKRRRTRVAKTAENKGESIKSIDQTTAEEPKTSVDVAEKTAEDEPIPEPIKDKVEASKEEKTVKEAAGVIDVMPDEVAEKPKPSKGGWWQRRTFF